MITTANAGDQPDTVTALLLLLTQHAEQLAVLDQREAGHHQQITAGLAELTRHLAQTSDRLDGISATATRQAAILNSLDGLDQQVAALAGQLTTLSASSSADGAEPGQPAPAPRWWNLHGHEREEALTRLRAWVGQVYRPGYGHLAASLGPCWEQHALCLYGLDWLMELWSICYLTSQRRGPVLASQAEWQTRLLPALAEQMHLETTRCQHAQPARGQGPSPAVRAGSNGVHHPGGTRPAADR